MRFEFTILLQRRHDSFIIQGVGEIQKDFPMCILNIKLRMQGVIFIFWPKEKITGKGRLIYIFIKLQFTDGKIPGLFFNGSGLFSI